MTSVWLSLCAVLLILAAVIVLVRRERSLQNQVAQYRELVERLPDGVILVGADGFIQQQNIAAAQLLDSADSILVGSALSSWLPQLSEVQAQRQCTLAVSANGRQREIEITRLASGSTNSIVLIHRTSEHGNAPGDAERFKRSQYFARIGTWDWDVDTEQLYWSEAIYGMFGYKVGEVTPSYELFCSCVHPDDRAQVRAGELHCLATGENHDEEYRVIWPDGSIHWLRETGNVVKNTDDSTVKMMGVVRDITEEKASASHLQQLAHYDLLTGLPNRLALEDRLSKALEQARLSETRVVLVFVDLNSFKEINDHFGHAAGDRVLVTTATRLKKILRSSDTVARIGGDEFVIILEGLPQGKSLQDEAHSICEKIFVELSPPIAIGNDQRHIGTSLGVAVFPDHAPSMDKLIHIADLAMYEAKRSGNNQYRLGKEASWRAQGE
jgi:diguanylate cyclase (GGDEF)-like protein/PAS domain S-box-containing protein